MKKRVSEQEFKTTLWHTKSVKAVAQDLETDLEKGLTRQEAARRLQQFGPNQLADAKPVSPFVLFLSQFNDFIIWILLGAAFISGFLREWGDFAAIAAIVVLNAILGFVQEYRAERSLAALKKLSAPTCRVIREGERHTVSAQELVPGDLLSMEVGDHVMADARLVQTAWFRTQEAPLTGESVPVEKDLNAVLVENTALGDRSNMVYLGTSAVSGKATAMVVETGMRTELGRIAKLIEEAGAEKTPLQRKLDELGKVLVYISFAVVALVFVLGVWRGGSWMDMFLTAVSLAVAAIPEGLPAIVTMALALGVVRMVKQHALIRKLPSVETLGCATVICSDKTGTLTQNEMMVTRVWAGGYLFHVTGTGYVPHGEVQLDGKAVPFGQFPDLTQVAEIATLCNSASLHREESGTWRMVGDPTEGALLACARKLGVDPEQANQGKRFVAEIPFDSQRKKMSVIYETPSGIRAFVKGAPDLILQDCTKLLHEGKEVELKAERKAQILEMNNRLTDEALRVLAVAYRTLPAGRTYFTPEQVERELVFVGLLGSIDPPRPEVAEAIGLCQKAGIKTVMITGDHRNTAVAIARQLGFFKADSIALSGEELNEIDDRQFEKEVEDVAVYARVSAEHKLRIVRTLRKKGEVVAMTGDGVNDAPAVKEADIGVAMGITGTDVTKEASDMVITDDNFASIVAAVKEGRGIFDNIKKSIYYLLSCNAGEVLVMFVSSLIGWPLPLFPIQILWVNLVTDGLPALALGVDPVDPKIMERPVRRQEEKVLPLSHLLGLLVQGTFIAACTLFAFFYVLFVEKEGLERARTMAFLVLACSQLFHAYNCRSQTESIFKLGVASNMKLVGATLISLFLQLGVVSVALLQPIFKTKMLTPFDWGLALLVSSLPLWGMEIIKAIRNAMADRNSTVERRE